MVNHYHFLFIAWSLLVLGVVQARMSSLRGVQASRQLSRWNDGNPSLDDNNGCNNGHNCDTKLAEFLANVKSTQDRRQQQHHQGKVATKKMTSSKKRPPNRDDGAVKPSCAKRGDCKDKRKEASHGQHETKQEEQVTSYLKLPPTSPDVNGEGGGSLTTSNDSPSSTTTNDDPTFTHLTNFGLPCCCSCATLPCDCHCGSLQDSDVFKKLHQEMNRQGSTIDEQGKPTNTYTYNQDEPCAGGNCRTGGATVQGSAATANGFGSAGDSARNDSSVLCCCPKCTSFPCHCSCNYFTLSRIPT